MRLRLPACGLLVLMTGSGARLERNLRMFYHIAASLILIIMFGCAGAVNLKTDSADPNEPTGTFTLLLHGGRYGDDMQNVAILDREGDGFTFELYAPGYDYKIKRGVPAAEAIAGAEQFVRFHHAFWKSQWSRILDQGGAVLGYEVKPLYEPLETGYPDVLDISYIIRGVKVVARIQFKPEMERSLSGERDFPIFRRMR